MKLLSLTLLMILISCGKESGGNHPERKIEQETFTMNGEETILKDKLMKKKNWKQSELLKTLVLTKGMTSSTLRKLDRVLNINCNGSTGNCSLTPKDKP